MNFPEGSGQKLPYVVLEDEGALGEYNRANRSLGHFVENVANTLLNIGLGGALWEKCPGCIRGRG